MVKKTNTGAIAGIISGAVIIILAVVMLTGAFNPSGLSTSSQFQMKYSFGADFYTEMFGVTYSILEQLENMSSDNAANLAFAINAITKSLGFVVLAIGIGVLGLSFTKLYVWIPQERNTTPDAEKPQLDESVRKIKEETEEAQSEIEESARETEEATENLAADTSEVDP